MQFVTNGPDIPDALLQAHEEGRVVFFCGAGISYPAGLPGFKGLVEQIYQLSGTTLSDIENEAFERGQFDATLDLLERRLPGQRLAVRSKLAQALKPKLHRKGAIDTQAALLRLARSREGALRLVTTNFDRIFHVAAKRTGQAFQAYAAPMLPIPKNSRWNGLVYLHGLLPEKADDTALNRLVVSSGDFGLAYLTERWAARFVSELFRNYVVCFVGYSINDPVLRYMMDALAADRMQGEVTPQAWALGDCEPGQEHRKTIEWEAKGVTPILYNTYAALGPTEGYTVEEFRTAIGALPQEGLEESAQALSQALEGAADQREDYWRNRAQPFWQQIWPKSRDLATRRIAESLTRMVIAARGEFPTALAAVREWLQPIEHPHYVVHLLHESGLCSRYSADALSLLSAVIADQQWGARELGQCMAHSSPKCNGVDDSVPIRLKVK